MSGAVNVTGGPKDCTSLEVMFHGNARGLYRRQTRRVVRQPTDNSVLLLVRSGQGLQVLAKYGPNIGKLSGMHKLDLAETVYHQGIGERASAKL
jgi:hypothetical protein